MKQRVTHIDEVIFSKVKHDKVTCVGLGCQCKHQGFPCKRVIISSSNNPISTVCMEPHSGFVLIPVQLMINVNHNRLFFYSISNQDCLECVGSLQQFIELYYYILN